MSYRTRCDWCGGLAYEDDVAVMPVTIYRHKGRGLPEAKWIEETCVMRHFCVAPTGYSGEGRSRAELGAAVHPDTCYDRALDSEQLQQRPVTRPQPLERSLYGDGVLLGHQPLGGVRSVAGQIGQRV